MRKSNISILIFVLIAVSFVYFFFKFQSSEKVAEIENQIPNTDTELKDLLLVDQSLFKEEIYNKPNKFVTFDVTYPQFKNVSMEFNKEIEGFVMKGIEDNINDSETNWKIRLANKLPDEEILNFPSENEKYSFNVSWKPVQANDQYISILLVTSGYTGGAHGYQNLNSFNFDVPNEEEVVLSELFPGDPNYLKTISEFSRSDLTKQFRERLEVRTQGDEENFQGSVIPMILSGTTPSKVNFNVFTFTSEAITFYFQEYQVAPYAMGVSEVVMLRE